MVFGMVDKVLFVAFTKREADRIRIISARPAEQEKNECRFKGLSRSAQATMPVPIQYTHGRSDGNFFTTIIVSF